MAFVEFNGKRHYLSGKYKSPESLAAYQAFLRNHGLLGFTQDAKPVHIVTLINRFLDWAGDTYPVGTRSEWMNCQSALKHLRALDGNRPVTDYGPARLKALQASLAQAKLSRNYINAVCARVRRMFKWAASEELAPASIYHALVTVPGLRRDRSPAVETAPREPVTREQVETIRGEVSATIWAMLELQWLTGVRSQSICQARPEQFDQTKQPWEWRPRHKTERLGHALVVFVGPRAQAVLAPFLAGRKPGDYLFEPKHLNGHRAKGFRAFYDSVSYLRAISRAQDRINAERERQGLERLPKWTPHQIRHAKATSVRTAYGIEGSQATLGHKTIAAAQIYAGKQTDLARTIAQESG